MIQLFVVETVSRSVGVAVRELALLVGIMAMVVILMIVVDIVVVFGITMTVIVAAMIFAKART